MAMARIADDPGTPRHGKALDYFNHLIFDLKKQLLGAPHDAITWERLKQGDDYISELDADRVPTRFY